MNIIKKVAVVVVLILTAGHLFADRQIGTVPNFVKDESDILEVCVDEDNVPALIVKEEREGFVSTITEYFVIYGKEKLGPYYRVNSFTFTFFPNGKTLLYTATIDGKRYAYVGKEKIGPFDDEGFPEFSPDGKALAYRAKIGEKWYLYVGKEKLGPFDNVGLPEFSPDGKTLAYSAEIDGKEYLYIGKEKIGPFDYVGLPKFSPDGKTLAYRVEIDKKWYLYVGKEKLGPFDNVNYLLTFSLDGKSISYSCDIGNHWYRKLVLDFQTYTGSVCGEKVVYIKDGKIMLRE